MSDEKIYEKIIEDMSEIEIPDRLAPSKMMKKIEKIKPDRKVVKFNRRKMNVASRVIAACVVLCVSVGVGAVAITNSNNAKKAESQAIMAMADNESESSCEESVEETIKMGIAAGNNDGADASATDSDTAENSAGNTIDASTLGADELGRFKRASDWTDVYKKYFYSETSDYDYGYGYGLLDDVQYKGDINFAFSEADEAADMDDSAPTIENSLTTAASGNSTDGENYYTDTILQTEGVSEADIIKTDGTNIYVLYNDKIKIMRASDLELLSEIDAFLEERKSIEKDEADSDDSDEEYVFYYRRHSSLDTVEIYVSDNILYVIGNESVTRTGDEPGYKQTTRIKAYDISDASKPKFKYDLSQDGSYNTSRMIGNKLYLITDNSKINYFVCFDEATCGDDDVLKEWVPQVNGCMVPLYDMYTTDESTDQYTFISCFNTDDGAVVDSKVIYDCVGGQIYMTNDNLYLYSYVWDEEGDSLGLGYEWYSMTEICKFSLNDGYITAEATATFAGSITDTFAIHEDGDYLYLLMEFSGEEKTDDEDYEDYNWRTFSTLYVLDKDLNVKGKIDEIAEDEYVYSARFFGNIGYFVTYRNMDPLFAVDFSDPCNPTILGELEMPGFSSYLQAWGDNYLLGIGEERDENSNFIGLKLSLYDISDPVNMVEVDKLVIKDAYASSQYDYKKLLADYKTGLISMVIEGYDYDDDYAYHKSAYVFRVEDGHFKTDAEIELDSEYNWQYDSYRIQYIDGSIYVMDNNVMRAYDSKDGYKEFANLEFEEIESEEIIYWID